MAQSTLGSVREASTGTLVVTDHLNFWDGKRVKPRQGTNPEPVYEPATGKYGRFSMQLMFECQMLLITGRKLSELHRRVERDTFSVGVRKSVTVV